VHVQQSCDYVHIVDRCGGNDRYFTRFDLVIASSANSSANSSGIFASFVPLFVT